MKHLIQQTLAVAALTVATSSLATPFTLNTGAVWDGTKFTQLPNGAPEARYDVSGLYTTATVQYDTQYPLVSGPWIGNVNPDGGQWIKTGENVGTTLYSISFIMPAPLALGVSWASDNPSLLSLNGSTVGTTDGWPNTDTQDYRRWETATLNLVAGLNTVSFEVRNLGGPAGLIVNSATFETGPAPSVSIPDGGSTLIALGLALTGLAGFRRSLTRA